MVKGTVRVLALTAATCVALAACGSRPSSSAGSTTSGSASGSGLNACMVLDVGGVDDRSFNESAWKGMQDAKAQNSSIQISYVSSSSQNDYVPNLTAEVQKGCQTTIAVGGLMTQSLMGVAKANPSKRFAIID